MLVLTRNKNDQIMIDGDNIIITVVDIRGDKVRLGIEAPREMSVHRREVYDAIKQEEKNARYRKAYGGDPAPRTENSQVEHGKQPTTDNEDI